VKKLLWSLLIVYGSAFAQEPQTTSNLIYSTTNPAPPGASYSWSGFVVNNTTGGGFSGGNVPAYNPDNGTFYFGYGQSTIAYSIAINSALSGSGIQIGGMNYGFEYLNQDFNRGTLSTTINLLSNTGATLQSYTHNLPQTTQGWTNFSQTQTFANQYSLSNLGNATLTVTGQDDRFWAGYYGPAFRNQYLTFTYTADICASNPLSSPDCPGYAAAYQTQQCSINPLFSPSCPGYTSAQCNINPLYSQVCPGYAAAYLTQQCNLDGLYSTSCPNYAEAYAKKYLLNVDTSGTSSSTQTTNTPSTTEPTTTVSNDGKVKTEVSKTGDSNVDSVIESKATSASPSDATATVKLTPSPSGGQSAGTQTNTKTETKTETTAAPSSNQQQTTRTARTERTEQKSGTNESKSNSEMKQAAQQKAKEEMKKAEGATSFEGQIATQAAVVNAIAFVPGFDAYQTAKIIDVNALQLQRQYGKDVVDNRRLGRGLFGPSDTRHQEMVNQQYR
jgi:hypothetical protein